MGKKRQISQSEIRRRTRNDRAPEVPKDQRPARTPGSSPFAVGDAFHPMNPIFRGLQRLSRR